MKKTFKSLFVGVLALMAVSCYDDTALRTDINTVKEDVTSLKQKIAELEEKLNTEIAAINNVIAQKVAVVGVEKKNGTVVLTLSDNSKVTVASTSANLVTTETKDGKTYWAYIKEDGTVEATTVEVGHPDVKLSFKVDASTKELQISYNGKDFSGTGVIIKDPDSYKHIVTGFEDGEDSVTIKIGDASYELQKVVDDTASIVLSRSNFYLMYEAKKEVELTAEGIEDYYVISKPDGWKAVLEGTTLTVVAPSEVLAEMGAADKSGLIIIHATSDEGKCKTAKLEVETGLGLTLDVTKDGEVVIQNAYASEQFDPIWGDSMGYQFSNFAFGFATPEFFKPDPTAYFEALLEGYLDDVFGAFYDRFQPGEYVEGEKEIDVINTSFAEIYEAIFYEELDPAYKFVFWIAPVSEMGQPIISQVLFVDSPITINAELVDAGHDDIEIKLTTYGADSYIIGKINESAYYSEWNPLTLEDYLTDPMGGPWIGFTQAGVSMALGTLDTISGVRNVKLSEITSFGNPASPLEYGEKYSVWVLPLFDNKEASEYILEEDLLPYIFEFSTEEIVSGGTWTPELEQVNEDYFSINVEITPSDSTERVYYNFYTPSAYAQFSDDAELLEDLIYKCSRPVYGEAQIVSKTNLKFSTSYVLAAISVGSDGKYGSVVDLTASTLDAPINEDITITASSVVKNEDGSHTVTFDVTGASYVVGYYIGNATNTNYVIENTIKYGVTKKSSSIIFADVVDGKATVNFAANTRKSYFYGLAYNIDTVDNVVSEISEVFVDAFADYTTAE